MHAFPSVEEVDRYITERLLIAGSEQPNIFTPGAVDFIFQCSEGIPRNINNICDNAMLAAYAAGEQVIGRQVIEEVADNLDMLPRREAFQSAGPAQDVPAGRVLKSDAHEEIRDGEARHENVKPRVFTENFSQPNSYGYGNGNGNSNGYSNASSNGSGYYEQAGDAPANSSFNEYRPDGLIFEETDEDVALEIDEFISSFRRF